MFQAQPPRYDFRILPPNVHVPGNSSANFQGRKENLSELYRQMIGNLSKVGLNQVGAVGMGGIGKTQLAIEFVHRFSFAFEGIFWVDAADSNKWLPQIVEIAKIGCSSRDRESDRRRDDAPIRCSPQKYCGEHRRTLIIMDNVREPALLNSKSPLFGTAVLNLGCNLLFTTRSHFHLDGVVEHALDILSAEAASALLAGMRPQVNAAERNAAELICRAVGNLPLALVLIGSFLRNKESVSYTAYYGGLQERGLPAIELEKVPPEELASRHQGAVSDVLREQLAMVDNESARLPFKLAGHFPENETIPKARLGLLAGVDNASVFERALDNAFLARTSESSGARGRRFGSSVAPFGQGLRLEIGGGG